MPEPAVRVQQDWKGHWGVQVKWPKSGPWTRTLIFPRWCWHGPLGNRTARWPDRVGADAFAKLLTDTIADVVIRSNPDA